MIVDIEKIVVKNPIRKDFGDISELADDIQQNGLINPPVVNKDYELLAGERRLRACRSLGWKQIEIRMMDTRDAEHELNVEISENENRKEFSKSERVDYMKRLLRIEQAKAEERMKAGTNPSQKSDEGGRADDAVAKQFDVSRDTLRKEISIVDHKEALAPEDFADWDEGRLSTNKAYQAIKKVLAEKERRIEELESDQEKPTMRDKFYKERIKDLNAVNDGLKARVVELEHSEFELKSQLEEIENAASETNSVETDCVADVNKTDAREWVREMVLNSIRQAVRDLEDAEHFCSGILVDDALGKCVNKLKQPANQLKKIESELINLVAPGDDEACQE